MSGLSAAVVSITPTRRRRFLWAAWWTAAPERAPFTKPDAFLGGARTREEARRQAEEAAARPLHEVEGRWARAWARILVGEPPFSEKETRAAGDPGAEHALPRRAPAPPTGSIWATLGILPLATVEDIKRAFRKHALATHPDHGGDPAQFRQVRRAYVEALSRRARSPLRPGRD